MNEAVDAVHLKLSELTDWSLTGGREGEYKHDLLADRAACDVLANAGLSVLSEESGISHSDLGLTIVVDPVDGSTNASRNLPWWATSLCAIDESGALAAVVANHVTGNRYEAIRGRGARCNGKRITPSATVSLEESIVAFSGYPLHHYGWGQYRSLGAAALDLCAVAAGHLDGFVDCGKTSLAPWDYLGGLLVCQEAGAHVVELKDRELVTVGHGERRTVLAAGTVQLLEELRHHRLTDESFG